MWTKWTKTQFEFIMVHFGQVRLWRQRKAYLRYGVMIAIPIISHEYNYMYKDFPGDTNSTGYLIHRFPVKFSHMKLMPHFNRSTFYHSFYVRMQKYSFDSINLFKLRNQRIFVPSSKSEFDLSCAQKREEFTRRHTCTE